MRNPPMLVVAVGLAVLGAALPTARAARNVILMVSDGQGYNHVAAARLYSGTTPVYETFPTRLAVATFPLNFSSAPTGGHVQVGGYDPAAYWADFNYPKANYTDSAAAATALSTGVKTYNSSINYDNDPAATGTPLKSIFEIARDNGKATGSISTVQWSHATPAAFGAHNINRGNYAALATEMLNSGKLDVILGAGNPDYNNDGVLVATPQNAQYVGGAAAWAALKAGTTPFHLVQEKADFERLAAGDLGFLTKGKVCGTVQAYETLQQRRGAGDPQGVHPETFLANVPTPAVLARAGLNVLNANPNGFFVMMEAGGAVDWAAHAAQKGRVIEEQTAFNDAVSAVVEWVTANSSWEETLLIVTADHETGHLWGASGAYTELTGAGAEVLGSMVFNSGSHTNALVPLYAIGAGAELFSQYVIGTDLRRGSYIDNTAVFRVMAAATDIPEPATAALLAAAGLLALRRRPSPKA